MKGWREAEQPDFSFCLLKFNTEKQVVITAAAEAEEDALLGSKGF